MRNLFLTIILFTLIIYSCGSALKKNSQTTMKYQEDSLTYIKESLATQANEDSIEKVSNQVNDTFNIKTVFEPKLDISITNETKSFIVEGFNFIVTWSDSLVFSKAYERFIPGIKKLVITKGKKVIQIFKNIPDEDAVGLIRFAAYDYNFDGNIDFTLPLGTSGKSNYFKYYLFDPNKNEFEYVSSWDYVRFGDINPNEKLVRTVVEGTCCSVDWKIYKVNNTELTEIAKFHSGDETEK